MSILNAIVIQLSPGDSHLLPLNHPVDTRLIPVMGDYWVKFPFVILESLLSHPAISDVNWVTMGEEFHG